MTAENVPRWRSLDRHNPEAFEVNPNRARLWLDQ